MLTHAPDKNRETERSGGAQRKTTLTAPAFRPGVVTAVNTPRPLPPRQPTAVRRRARQSPLPGTPVPAREPSCSRQRAHLCPRRRARKSPANGTCASSPGCKDFYIDLSVSPKGPTRCDFPPHGRLRAQTSHPRGIGRTKCQNDNRRPNSSESCNAPTRCRSASAWNGPDSASLSGKATRRASRCSSS